MNNILEIDTFGNKLENSITIKSKNFGDVVFEYTILNIKTNKFLRYKIGENPEIFMVNYNIIEEKLTLNEYFRNALKFLYIQLKEIRTNHNLREALQDTEKQLIKYLDDLNKNYSQ